MPQRDLSLNDALSDYYQVRRGRYELSSWRGHQARLEHWRGWVVRETQTGIYISDIADPDSRYMERYFNRLRPPAYAPSSFNNARIQLAAFWKYCRARGWVTENPMMHIDPLKVPRRVRLQLAAAELLSMLDGAIPRDRVALALGMNTGLRAGDIATLKIGSVNLANNWLEVWIQKTKKWKTYPISVELRAELLRWFDAYAEKMGTTAAALPNTWTLVPPIQSTSIRPYQSEDGERRTTYRTAGKLSAPQVIVQTALEKLGHPTHQEGFHTLRRSAARVLYDMAKAKGLPDPITYPQALLDHGKRGVTEDYLGVTHERDLFNDLVRGESFLGQAAELDAAKNAAQALRSTGSLAAGDLDELRDERRRRSA